MKEHCHTLKHQIGAAADLLAEMEAILSPKSLSNLIQDGLQEAITYFRNHHHQMHYAEALSHHLPIGSGVTRSRM